MQNQVIANLLIKNKNRMLLPVELQKLHKYNQLRIYIFGAKADIWQEQFFWVWVYSLQPCKVYCSKKLYFNDIPAIPMRRSMLVIFPTGYLICGSINMLCLSRFIR